MERCEIGVATLSRATELHGIKITLNGGSLGSWVDEERS